MSRHQAREAALQVLFQVDVGHTEPEAALRQAVAQASAAERAEDRAQPRDWEYVRRLVVGAWSERTGIDAEIARLAREWRLERMANVDRNILRLAIFELTHESEVPASVVADEAVRLAQTFSTGESGRFVNGILGALIRERESGGRREVAPHATGDVPGN